MGTQANPEKPGMESADRPTGAGDVATWRATAVVEKYHGDGAFDPDATPYEVTEPVHNLLMTAGVNMIWQLVTGQGGTAFSSTGAYIGVGDSSTAAAATQTDLQASTNKLRKQVSGAPAISNNVCTFSATFGTSDGNWNWNEIAVFNASASGTMLNRFVAGLGAKSNSASWTINVTVTIQ